LKIHLPLTVFALILFFGCQTEKESAEVQRRDLKELIYASATVNAADMYRAYAPVPGIIGEILVEEGDTVQKGQLLAIIRRDNASLNTRDAGINLELTRNKALDIKDQLMQLESEIDILQQQLDRDSSLYARQKNLWAQNIGTRNDLDRLETVFKNNKTRFIRLKSQYQIKKDQLSEQITLQEQRARILLEQRQNNSKDYEIRSQLAGKVYSVLREPGEMLSSQVALFELGQKDNFIVEMDVDESDIPDIHPGQTAYIAMDAFKGQTFELNIEKVQPKMDERSQTFTVESIFMNPPTPLYPGLTGEVNILVQSKSSVLTVPNEYLNNNDELQTDDGLIKVETGISTMEFTELRSSIEEGTIIYPHKS